jgi:hypothetical protein
MIETKEALKHRDDKFVSGIFRKPVKGEKRKKSEKASKDSSFKKQLIFFRNLPYWKEFKIGHAINTMHIKKGVFESVISLLLDISSKTKDGLSARKDIQTLGIREELHPHKRLNEKAYLPPASYTLTTQEKRVIRKCLCIIRVHIGFSSNIKNLVSMSDLRMSGYNTCDCHTMLSLYLVMAIRAINHTYSFSSQV